MELRSRPLLGNRTNGTEPASSSAISIIKHRMVSRQDSPSSQPVGEAWHSKVTMQFLNGLKLRGGNAS
ncbi:hypothetical protein UVI_02051660 [Ustilaginoidea virens]|uniref:Uncharacterized protein n=1 Tax=Ustilaginoidea virens TaxID=1159556 RepID=A0A1B5L0H0_USTVR|nr:hypothetical protein UVI_02051660 [Ustilaginoidea virens]